MEKYLNVAECTRALAPVRFRLLKEVDSTNDFLKRELKRSLDDKDIFVVAENQTSGKGTKGRKWVDAPSSCLKISFRKKIPCPPENPSILSPLIALRLKEALEAAGFKGVSVKWPNDLLIDGSKTAGILLEMVRHHDDSYLIVGIGINLFFDENISRETGREVGFLMGKEKSSERRRTEVMVLIGKVLKEVLSDIPERMNSETIHSWNRADYYFGTDISIQTGEGVLTEGIDGGIDSYGKLILHSQTADNAFFDGEIFK